MTQRSGRDFERESVTKTKTAALDPSVTFDLRKMQTDDFQVKDYGDLGLSTSISQTRHEFSEHSFHKENAPENLEDDFKAFTEIVNQARQLNAKKANFINFLDENDEVFINSELDHMRADKLAHKYRQLFYRARDAKKLLFEFGDNSALLTDSIESLLEDKVRNSSQQLI